MVCRRFNGLRLADDRETITTKQEHEHPRRFNGLRLADDRETGLEFCFNPVSTSFNGLRLADDRETPTGLPERQEGVVSMA